MNFKLILSFWTQKLNLGLIFDEKWARERALSTSNFSRTETGMPSENFDACTVGKIVRARSEQPSDSQKRATRRVVIKKKKE